MELPAASKNCANANIKSKNIFLRGLAFDMWDLSWSLSSRSKSAVIVAADADAATAGAGSGVFGVSIAGLVVS